MYNRQWSELIPISWGGGGGGRRVKVLYVEKWTQPFTP